MENELQNSRDLPQQNFQPQQPELPMNWHKVLIYFVLWAGAVTNIFSAAGMFTGGIYGGSAAAVYETFPMMRTADWVYGAVLLVLAVYQIMTRFALAGFRKKGPGMLTVLYLVSMVCSLLYPLMASFATGISFLQQLPSLLSSLVGAGAMVFINRSYYKKRMHLFIND